LEKLSKGDQLDFGWELFWLSPIKVSVAACAKDAQNVIPELFYQNSALDRSIRNTKFHVAQTKHGINDNHRLNHY